MHKLSEVSEVLLKTSARAMHSSLIGIGATAIAERQDMTPDEVKELRGAVDAAMAMLVDAPAFGTPHMIARFLIGGRNMQVEIVRSDEAPISRDAQARFDAAVAGIDVTVMVESASGRLHLSKQFGSKL